MSDWLLELIGKIVVGIVVAIVVAWVKRRWDSRKVNPNPSEAPDMQKIESYCDLPLTKEYEGNLPIGYYRLREGLAKRMEPKFYAQLNDYLSQVFGVCFAAVFICFVGLSQLVEGNSEDAALMFVIGVVIFSAVFPWKSFFGNYKNQK